MVNLKRKSEHFRIVSSKYLIFFIKNVLIAIFALHAVTDVLYDFPVIQNIFIIQMFDIWIHENLKWAVLSKKYRLIHGQMPVLFLHGLAVRLHYIRLDRL